jgi:hypothetical protein
VLVSEAAAQVPEEALQIAYKQQTSKEERVMVKIPIYYSTVGTF